MVQFQNMYAQLYFMNEKHGAVIAFNTAYTVKVIVSLTPRAVPPHAGVMKILFSPSGRSVNCSGEVPTKKLVSPVNILLCTYILQLVSHLLYR